MKKIGKYLYTKYQGSRIYRSIQENFPVIPYKPNWMCDPTPWAGTFLSQVK